MYQGAPRLRRDSSAKASVLGSLELWLTAEFWRSRSSGGLVFIPYVEIGVWAEAVGFPRIQTAPVCRRAACSRAPNNRKHLSANSLVLQMSHWLEQHFTCFRLEAPKGQGSRYRG